MLVGMSLPRELTSIVFEIVCSELSNRPGCTPYIRGRQFYSIKVIRRIQVESIEHGLWHNQFCHCSFVLLPNLSNQAEFRSVSNLLKQIIKHINRISRYNNPLLARSLYTSSCWKEEAAESMKVCLAAREKRGEPRLPLIESSPFQS